MKVKDNVKKNKKLLKKIKNKALDGSVYGMLPKALVHFIYNLNETDNEEYIKYIMILTEQYFHIKGYYTRHPQKHEEDNYDIKLKVAHFKKFGYAID